MELRNYQIECLNKIEQAIQAQKGKFMICLPTGAGKTVIFANLIKKLNVPTLIIAHRNELLKQAQNKLKEVGVDSVIVRDQSFFEFNVVIISAQSLINKLDYFDPEKYKLVIIDECHHSMAPTYQKIISHFDQWYVIGFTATPYRTDNQNLYEMFTSGIVYQQTQTELTQKGYLTPINTIYYQTPSYTKENIYQAYQTYGNNKKVIIFCQSVAHADETAEFFISQGIQAASVHNKVPKDLREHILSSFATNGTKVLTNYNILTEGYDEPTIECVIMARKTTSKGLHTQCLGRGTRLSPGKTHLNVIQMSSKTFKKGKKALRNTTYSTTREIDYGFSGFLWWLLGASLSYGLIFFVLFKVVMLIKACVE